MKPTNRLLIITLLIFLIGTLSCKKGKKCYLPTADFLYDSLSADFGKPIQIANFTKNASRYRWEITPTEPASYFLESKSTVYIGEPGVNPTLVANGGTTIKLTAGNHCYESNSITKNFGRASLISKSSPEQTINGGACFSIGSKVYMCLGSSSNQFWEWDQASDTWTKKANRPGADRSDAVGFSIGSKGYIGTGKGLDGKGLKDFWEWNQVTNIWTKKADFGGGTRIGAVSFSIGTKGYIGTGLGDLYYQGTTTPISTIIKQDFWEWDQKTNVWTQITSFGGEGRINAVGFSMGNKGYVGVGTTKEYGYDYIDFWEWNPTANRWTRKADITGTHKCNYVGFSIENKAYIGGVGRDGGAFKCFWEWNPTTNSWRERFNAGNYISASGNYTPNEAVACSIGEKGYLYIYNSSQNKKYFLEFDPTKK